MKIPKLQNAWSTINYPKWWEKPQNDDNITIPYRADLIFPSQVWSNNTGKFTWNNWKYKNNKFSSIPIFKWIGNTGLQGQYKPSLTPDAKLQEKQYWYKDNVDQRINENGELTDFGKQWLDLMLEHINKSNATWNVLNTIKQNDYKFPQEPVTIGGITYNKLSDFIRGRAFDQLQGPWHATGTATALGTHLSSQDTPGSKDYYSLQGNILNNPNKGNYRYDTLTYRMITNDQSAETKDRKSIPIDETSQVRPVLDWKDFNLPVPGEDPNKPDLGDVRGYLEGKYPYHIEKPRSATIKVEIPKGSKNGFLSALFNKVKGFNSNIKTARDNNPFIDQALRVIADNFHNTWNYNRTIKELQPVLKKYTPSYREVSGDYIAQKQSEEYAARLRNVRPITANTQAQSAIDQEAIQKGNQIIQQGNLQDATRYRQTSEAAWTQSKENTVGWNEIANANQASLAEFKNKIAQLKHEMHRQNQQNIDTLLTDREKRKWEEYDIERKKKLDLQESIDALGDNNFLYDDDYDNKAAAYKELATQYFIDRNSLNAEQKQNMADLKRYLDREVIRREYQKVFNKAQRYRVNYNLPGMFEVQNGKVIYKGKNGLKFQLGGVAAASSYVPSNIYKASSYPPTTSSKKKASSSDDDEQDKLLKNIVETVKGIKGLTSDVEYLTGFLQGFFNTSKYDRFQSEESLYTTYLQALDLVNKVNRNKETYDKAYDELSKRGALGSPAIDREGRVYVGVAGTKEIAKISPQEYLNNTDKYQILSNGNLLALRDVRKDMAFNNRDLIEVSGNGTNMESISKYIKDVVGQLGTNTESTDMLVRALGPQGVQGLQTLKALASKGISNAETNAVIASLNALTELNLTTATQAEQAEMALNGLYGMLQPNMQSMLLLQAGSKENVQKLLTYMIFKGINNKVNFQIKDFNTVDENGNIVGSKSKGNSSGGSSSEENQDQSLKAIQTGKGGTSETVKLNPGTKSEMSQIGINYYIGSAGSLENMLEETNLKSISDTRKIYFGDQLVDPQYLSDIAFLNRGVSRMILPIKLDGSPDFEIFKRFDKVCDNVRKQGYQPFGETDDTRKKEASKLLAKELDKEGLYGLINNGMPDMRKVGLFIVADCQTSDKAKIHASEFVEQVKDPDYEKFKQLLGTKGPDGKFHPYEIDNPSLINPADWFNFYDHIYQGTVYIPISYNELQGSIGAGNKIKDSTAKGYEANYQSWQAIRKSGRNPDESSSEKLNLNETE